MSVRIPRSLVGVLSELAYGPETYMVNKDGVVLGASDDVQTKLLALDGFESCDEAQGPDVGETLTRSVRDLTPAEIRERLDQHIQRSSPKSYEEARTIARKFLLDTCGTECPDWLNASERAGLGFEPIKARPASLADAIANEEKVVLPPPPPDGPVQDDGIPADDPPPPPPAPKPAAPAASRFVAEPAAPRRGAAKKG